MPRFWRAPSPMSLNKFWTRPSPGASTAPRRNAWPRSIYC